MQELPTVKSTPGAETGVATIPSATQGPTASDFFRPLRMSAEANRSTLGVETDSVTPELLMAASSKLLAINRREAEPDPKDSMEFQRVYGPADYFAEHILRDGSRVARQLLWKATNKGGLDFMPVGALDQHVSDVFNSSKLANMVDGSSPLELVEAAMKITRVGEGGVGDVQSAPDEMRLVQPSFLGFIDPVRCYSADTELWTRRGWRQVSDLSLDDELACLVDGRIEYHRPEALHSYEFDGTLYGYDDGELSYLVTGNHRMWVSAEGDDGSYAIRDAASMHTLACLVHAGDPSPDAWTQHALRPDGYLTEEYRGRVHCPTVPGGLVFCRRLGRTGFWCGNSVESLRVGLDAYLTKHCMKGSDGKLYQWFVNARTGKRELLDSVTAARSVITTPDEMRRTTRNVFALGGRTGVRVVPRDSVDYYLPNMDDAFTTASNLVPGLSSVKELRLLMGCLHPATPVMRLNGSRLLELVPASEIAAGDRLVTSGGEVRRVRTVVTRLPLHGMVRVRTLSGRVALVTPDHRWPVLGEDGEERLVPTSKLRRGDRLVRMLPASLPCRRSFVQGLQVTAATGLVLGTALRSLERTEDGAARLLVAERHLEAVTRELERRSAEVSREPDAEWEGAERLTVTGDFARWLLSACLSPDGSRVAPPELLGAEPKVASSALDAYTADLTLVAEDADEGMWLVDIPTPGLRQALAILAGRSGLDSDYRDGACRALRLRPADLTSPTAADPVASVTPVSGGCPAVIDIDVDDATYALGCGLVTHNSKYPQQAVSIEGREPPLVRGLDAASGKDMQSVIGRYLGALYAPKAGTVRAVRRDRVDMDYDDGTRGSIALYRSFPMNAKGLIESTARVKAGDRLEKGGLIASSNYTDDKGVAAVGTNLRTGWLSWKGGTYEDAIVLSETAARKLTSTTMYQTALDLDRTVQLGRDNYTAWKPSEFSAEQLAALDRDGVVRPGTVLRKGDPMVLAVRVTQPSPGTMGRRVLDDLSETWQHDHPGVVTDVLRTRKGVKVLATVTAPLEVGDKISGSHGNKGIVSMVLPDDQMPKDASGQPLEVILSPLGLVSRCYHPDTELRTQDGWRAIADIRDDDLVAQLDPLTLVETLVPQTAPMHSAPFEGELIGYDDGEVSFLVTPRHTIPVFSTDGGAGAITAEKAFGTDLLVVVAGADSPDAPEPGLPVTRHLRADAWRRVPYAGPVICPSVPSGVVATRLGGHRVCLGNTNPAQLHETLLGKVARRTGKFEVLPAFPDGNVREHVLRRLKETGLKADDDFFDPEDGRRIPNVVNGYTYFYKLKHLAESKLSARGTDEYSSDETPGGSGYEGSKRLGQLETSALAGHAAFDVLADAKLIRGQRNSEFWRSIRTGGIPTMPGEPLVQRKFFAHLQGSGVNVRKTPKGISVFALSDDDVRQMAGPRELRSRDTYEARTFRPLDGGLFGQDVFGPNGDRWAYIQLDEPLPNPVMADPLARLLRLSDRDFEAVCTGSKEVDGMASSEDVRKRLAGIDLDKESAAALDELRDATKSRRPAALKRYLAVERMRRQGVPPDQYMLTRLPVLPPVYRPISSHAGVTMVADANYLYAQMLDARDDLRAASSLPAEYRADARRNLWRSWQELTGMYDPEDVKLRSKNVGGLLQWALGKGSPKFSAFSRKVLGTSVDTVGRGVIQPDARLTIDEIGMPADMAFDTMAPFVTRALVKRGYTPVAAMGMVKDRHPQALDALKEVMATHPVLLNRAPTLHKYSIMAFRPVLVPGKTLHIHPSVCPGFAADFDGDSIENRLRLVFELDALEKKVEENGKDSLTPLESRVYSVANREHGAPESNRIGDDKMIKQETKCKFADMTCRMEDVPTVAGSMVQRGSVTEWDVPEGVFVDTVDPQTGERVLAPMTKVSRHTGLRMFDVYLSSKGSYGHVVTASDDHSLITASPVTGKLEKTRPEDCLGRLVPRVIRGLANGPERCLRTVRIGHGLQASHELGFVIGVIVGDGWVDSEDCLRIACAVPELQSHLLDLLRVERQVLPVTQDARAFRYATTEQRFGSTDMQRITIYTPLWFRQALRCAIGTGATAKRLPEDCLHASRAHMAGVLMGLLATDGSVNHSKPAAGKKSSSKSCIYHTTSVRLRDDLQELCLRLGIRTGVTPYRGVNSTTDCYAITLSLEDLVREMRRTPSLFQMHHAEKQAALDRIAEDMAVPSVKTSHDLVPFPAELRGPCVYCGVHMSHKDLFNRAIAGGYTSRAAAAGMLEAMEKCDLSGYVEPTSLPKRLRMGLSAEQAQAAVDTLRRIVREDAVTWELVTDVRPSQCTEGWDCTVPGPYTFTLAEGTVVQDTVNVHVPVSDAARRQAWDRMRPSRNLLGLADHGIMNKPEKEYMQGLYIASRMREGERPRDFRSLKEAQEAYRRGDIEVDTPIRLLDR